MSLLNQKRPEGVRGPATGKVGKAVFKILEIFSRALRARLMLLPLTRIILIGMAVSALAAVSFGLVQTVENGSYQIRQMIVTGTMSAKMEPGMWLRLFSGIETWPKAETFFFTKTERGTETVDRAIEVRFNDGSLCDISGTLRIILPSSGQQAIDLVTRYGYVNYADLEQKLILPVVRNALRLTANLMSARESYSEQRADFVFWTWDQVQNGIYETQEETRKVVDLVSGQEVTKTFKVIKEDARGNLVYQRNALEGLGLTLANFEVKLFDYTEKVRAQIGAQQTALMAVATARAKAQQAEQEAMMAEAEGKANVARDKYEEEQKKVRAIVQAQERLEVAELDKASAMVQARQRMEVAALDRQAAEATKQQEILLGQGEAERKHLVLQADGALKQKLEAYVQAQQLWANAYAQRQVPSLVMGGGGASATDNESTDFAQMMQLLVARQMGLDLTVPKGATRGTQ